MYVCCEGRGVGTQTSYGKFKTESSPPSDQPVFDHAYYATTPPSSSPEGEGATTNKNMLMIGMRYQNARENIQSCSASVNLL